MANSNFSYSEVLHSAFETTKKNFGVLFSCAAIILGIKLFGAFVQTLVLHDEVYKFSPLSSIMNLLLLIAQLAVSLGAMRICIKLVDGEPTNLGELTTCFRLAPRYLAGMFLIAFIAVIPFGLVSMIFGAGSTLVGNRLESAMLGFTLFVTASFVWLVYAYLRYGFFPYVLVDKGYTTLQSLKESARITKGSKMKLLGFLLLMGLIIFAGMLPLVIWVGVAAATLSQGLSIILASPILMTFCLAGLAFVGPFIGVVFATLYRRLSPRQEGSSSIEV